MSPGRGGGREVFDGLHLAWVRAPDLPEGEGWLSPRERAILAGLSLPKRRADWLLGRWAAKRAVSSLLGRPPAPEAMAGLEILPAEGGRPTLGAHVAEAAGVHLSISHAGGVGFAAAGHGPSALGCDVEVVEPRSDAFVVDYLTAPEAAAVRCLTPAAAALAANLVWSGKESALKALGEGLRMDTRRVEVDPACLPGSTVPGSAALGSPAPGEGPEWRPLGVAGPDGLRLEGAWRVWDGLVWTVLRVRPGPPAGRAPRLRPRC